MLTANDKVKNDLKDLLLTKNQQYAADDTSVLHTIGKKKNNGLTRLIKAKTQMGLNKTSDNKRLNNLRNKYYLMECYYHMLTDVYVEQVEEMHINNRDFRILR